ncbi:MAG: DUF2214 family protein [Synechococcaceae cyanobacterium RL_1_2]|nr:DUF2214 family protein [Synechococcaceae cyanobacterium RL_1_2]
MVLKSAIVAYIHYLSFAIIFATLTIEHLTFKAELTFKDAVKILIVDTLYGLAGTAILVTGILRVLYFGQGKEFYTENPVFWVKVGIFIFVGLLSLYPTISYLFWIKPLRAKEIPTVSELQAKLIPIVIRVELLGFGLIPLVATLMARGIGYPEVLSLLLP